MAGRHVGGVYGKPWSRMVGRPIKLTPAVMARLGQVLVDAVVVEAKKDFAKQGKSPKGPEGLPDSQTFFESFHYRVVGQSTIEVYSDWPYIQQVIEGRDPYPMTWLTRASGVTVVPILKDGGEVLFRAAPLSKGEAWVHPGFARHTFVQRGLQKGRVKMAQIATEEAVRTLAGGDILR